MALMLDENDELVIECVASVKEGKFRNADA